MNLANPHNEQAKTPIAKPLRIAVLLGDTVKPALKLGLLKQFENIQICPVDVVQSTLSQPTSLTVILDQAIAAIEQGKLVELSFNDGNRRHSLYLLDGLHAAKLRIHAHAFIVGFATGSDTASIANVALTTAKRSHAQTIQHHIAINTINEAFIALRSGITALAARTLPPLCGKNSNNSQTHYWFCSQHQARILCINLTTKTPNQADICQSIVLTQGTQLMAPKTIIDENRLFVPITASCVDSLKNKLLQLVITLNTNHSNTPFIPNQLAFWFENYDANAPLALVLMAASIDDLKLEAKAMLTALENDAVRNHGHPFKTPAGSCLTTKPLGNTGLTFVYPGVGTVYANMLSNLHEYFPELYQQLEREGDLSAMLQSTLIYATDIKTTASMNLSQLAISGVGASYLLTKLLTQIFNIQPQMALGYSMGEAAMWASLDVWQTPHTMINATENSNIFNHAISGELTAVRQAWQLKDDDPIIWNSFLVRVDSNKIKMLLPDHPRVYLAITQGDTCVIAGCEASCKALLAKLGKHGIATNRVTAMHTTPAMLVHEQVQDFYTQALKAEAHYSPIRFISAAQTMPVTIDSHNIGRTIADTFCAPLDFSSLIKNACKQGARLFVEVGADRQTCTLINKINHIHINKVNIPSPSTTVPPAIAIACNAKGGDTMTSLLKCLAQLICHRVPVSLAPLMSYSPSAVLPEGEPH